MSYLESRDTIHTVDGIRFINTIIGEKGVILIDSNNGKWYWNTKEFEKCEELYGLKKGDISCPLRVSYLNVFDFGVPGKRVTFIEKMNTESTVPSLDKDESVNNGGKTDYYQLSSAPFPINDFDDFAEWRKMDGFQFNIGKVAWTFNIGRHDATDEIRDLYKVIHYAKRRITKLKREKKQ